MSNTNLFTVVPSVILCVTAVFGLIRFLISLVKVIKNPAPPRIKGNPSDSGYSTDGYTGADSGWAWGDSGGHSSGDPGMSDPGSACDGGGWDSGGCHSE
jgi:hypothetical protein